jgi:hypothetical protein
LKLFVPTVTLDESFPVERNTTVADPLPVEFTTEAVKVRESVLALAKNVRVAVTAVVDSFTTAVSPVVPDSVKTSSDTTAADGVLDIMPNPRATTTPSAIRLKLVFLDMYFLSEVVLETFSNTAGKEFLFTS